MSYDDWLTLSPHAQRISRYIVFDKAEPVVGRGVSHPQRRERERIRQEQLDAMGDKAAEMYLRRG